MIELLSAALLLFVMAISAIAFVKVLLSIWKWLLR